jgi:hypothetical protein
MIGANHQRESREMIGTVVTLHPEMIEHRYWKALDIAKVESSRACRYVGEFPGKSKHGWTDFPIAVFYQEEPVAPYTNHYFGLYLSPITNLLMICDADYIANRPFSALMSDEGIVYSTCRHDFRKLGDSYIDGGWDYVRGNGGNTIGVQVVDGKFLEMRDEAQV